jgi:Zn-finger nucleic acid-binding protein
VACQKTCDLLEHVRILNNGRQVRECTACGGIYLTDGNPDKVIRRPRANPEA